VICLSTLADGNLLRDRRTVMVIREGQRELQRLCYLCTGIERKVCDHSPACPHDAQIRNPPLLSDCACSVIIPYAETWDDPVQPDGTVNGAPHPSDAPPSEPLCLTSPPSSWLSAALDFKNHLTIPSLGSFKPLSDLDRGSDAEGRAADSIR
jgi:hypothetical protein